MVSGGTFAVHDGEKGFDPSAVPMYPMLRAELRVADGTYLGLVDDKVVLSSTDIERVRHAVITSAAEMAARRIGVIQAIRVIGTAPDGGVFRMVVTAEGNVYDTTDPAPTGSAVSTTDRNVHPTPDLEQTKKGRPHPILLVIIAFPLVMVSLLAFVLLHGNGQSEEAATKLPGRRQIPVVVPEGYSPVAKWAVKVGGSAAPGTSGVAADAARVYTVAGSDRVTAYRAGNGAKEWSTDLGSPLTAGPAVVTVDGSPAVVAATSSKVLVLDPDSGEEVGGGKFDPEIGSQVRMTATGPVVSGQSNLAQIIVDGRFVTRAMPAGAQPVGPGPGGSLIAVTRDRLYTSTSSAVAGAGRPISAEGDSMTVAGWTGQMLVLAYSTSGDQPGVALAGYAPTDGMGTWAQTWVAPLPSATSGTVSTTTGQTMPLATGPSGWWGIYGSTAVDLTSGQTSDLGEWSTASIGDKKAFGTGAEQVLTAGGGGVFGRSVTAPSSQQLAAPQAVVGEKAFLLTAGGGTTSWLYALSSSRGGTQ